MDLQVTNAIVNKISTTEAHLKELNYLFTKQTGAITQSLVTFESRQNYVTSVSNRHRCQQSRRKNGVRRPQHFHFLYSPQMLGSWQRDVWFCPPKEIKISARCLAQYVSYSSNTRPTHYGSHWNVYSVHFWQPIEFWWSPSSEVYSLRYFSLLMPLLSLSHEEHSFLYLDVAS